MKSRVLFISWITVILLLIMVFLTCFSLYYTNREINRLGEIYKSKSILDSEGNSCGIYSFENDSIKIYKLTHKDLIEIKDHIKFLSQEVEKTNDHAQKIIEDDIHRLSIFMSLSIGFLAILGILAPFAINLFFRDDIKSQINSQNILFRASKITMTKSMKDSNNKIEKQNEQVLKLNGSIKDIKDTYDIVKEHIEEIKQINQEFPEIKTSIETIENDLRLKTPQVLLLSLQNNISRLFNITQIDIYVRNNKNQYFKDVFTSIKSSFESCKINNINPSQNAQYKIILNDFYDHINHKLFKFNIFKNNNELIENLNEALANLVKNIDKPLGERYESIIRTLENIISTFT